MRYFQSALYHSWSVGKSSVRFLLCPQILFESSFELSNIHGSYVVLCRLTWSASVRFVCCVPAMPWFEMFSFCSAEFYGRILLFGSWFDRRMVSDWLNVGTVEFLSRQSASFCSLDSTNPSTVSLVNCRRIAPIEPKNWLHWLGD